jgi:hypothetical protein
MIMAERRIKSGRAQVADPARERDEWIQLLRELVTQVDGWVKPAEWSTREIEKEMEDSVLGPYNAPALLMQRAFVRVLLEPITRFAPGTDGVVDLYRMPAYDDIASVYRVAGEWKLHQASGGSSTVARARGVEPIDLNQENFLRVLEANPGPGGISRISCRPDRRGSPQRSDCRRHPRAGRGKGMG